MQSGVRVEGGGGGGGLEKEKKRSFSMFIIKNHVNEASMFFVVFFRTFNVPNESLYLMISIWQDVGIRTCDFATVCYYTEPHQKISLRSPRFDKTAGAVFKKEK